MQQSFIFSMNIKSQWQSIYSTVLDIDPDSENVFEALGKTIYEVISSQDNITDIGETVTIKLTDENDLAATFFLKFTGDNKDDFYIQMPRWGDESTDLIDFYEEYGNDDVEPKHVRAFLPEENKYQYYTLYAPENGRFCVAYGRLGSSTYNQYLEDGTEIFKSDKEQFYFSCMFWIKYYEKLSKGYEDFTEYYDFDESPTVKKGKNSVKYKDIDDAKVKAIIDSLIKKQRDFVETKYDLTVPFSQQSIERSKELLKQMTSVINDGRMKDTTKAVKFNALYKELLLILPRKITSIDKYLAQTDFTDESSPSYVGKIIEKENELLDNFVSVTDIKKDESQKTVLEANGISMRIADFKDKWLVLDKMNRAESYGNKGHQAVNIYAVTNKKTEENFNKCLEELDIHKGGVHLYWHGSRLENWWSIMTNGLQLHPNAITTGKAFGQGIYFAPACGKSMNYVDTAGAYWATGGKGSRGCMAIYEVAMGKEYKVQDSVSYDFKFKDLKNGCHSVHALSTYNGGSWLRNDECIVYREDQCNIKYLIEFDTSRTQDFTFKRHPVIDNLEVKGPEIKGGNLVFECKNMNELCDKNSDKPVIATYDPKVQRIHFDDYNGTINASEAQFLADCVMSRYANNEYEFHDFADSLLTQKEGVSVSSETAEGFDLVF